MPRDMRRHTIDPETGARHYSIPRTTPKEDLERERQEAQDQVGTEGTDSPAEPTEEKKTSRRGRTTTKKALTTQNTPAGVGGKKGGKSDSKPDLTDEDTMEDALVDEANDQGIPAKGGNDKA